MKKLLQTVFKISLFGILLIMAFTGVKYAITITEISEQIEAPFIFACLAALILFVMAVGIAGRIVSFFLILAAAFVIKNALVYFLKKDRNTSEQI